MRCRLLAALLVLAAALLAAAPAVAAPAPRALTLRLADLPRGYVTSWSCEPSPPLAEEVGRHRNSNCVRSFRRIWTAPGVTPGPEDVISAAVVFRTPQEAAAALARPRLIASLAFETGPEDYRPPEPAATIGDETVLLRTTCGIAVIWRSGSMLGALLAGSSDERVQTVEPQAVLQLAATQQARIATPTALLPGENDDSEVALDDPALELPVWWLGRKLPRRGALPALRLQVSVPPERADRPEIGPFLRYGDSSWQSEVTLMLVEPRALSRPERRRDLRRRRLDPCVKIRRLALDEGHATIFRRDPSCPKPPVEEGPELVTAVVALPNIAVLVTADGCVGCHGPISRYGSVVGMRRIVRALHPRAPRPEPTP